MSDDISRREIKQVVEKAAEQTVSHGPDRSDMTISVPASMAEDLRKEAGLTLSPGYKWDDTRSKEFWDRRLNDE